MVVRCVMPFAKFDQMEHVEVCALCDTLASGFIANFLQTGSFVMPCGHSSAITCFAVEFFLFCGDLAGSSVYAGCADLSVKELYEHCIDMFVYECRVF